MKNIDLKNTHTHNISPLSQPELGERFQIFAISH